MAKGPSPLLGYNTNIRHKGKLYHVQTEDSGIEHPHIITHLFADGGRIVASRKTDYSEHLGKENLEDIVRELMKEQHKAMAVALRDQHLDEAQAPAVEDGARSAATADTQPVFDVDALEKAAEARQAASDFWSSVAGAPAGGSSPASGSGAESKRYQLPAQKDAAAPRGKMRNSIFGVDPADGRSLDEVILDYLHDDE